MPTYSESFDLKLGGGKEDIKIHVFDYVKPRTSSSSFEKDYGKESSLLHNKSLKQLICTSPCLYFGTKNITALNEERWNDFLRKGQEFEGFFIRTKNGKYDYCYKIWTNRRLPFAPLNYPSPKPNKIYELIIIDKCGDYLGLASGPHLAFCKIDEMIENGIEVENLSFPCAGGFGKLIRAFKEIPPEIPYAAYRVIPVSEKQSELEESSEIKIEKTDANSDYEEKENEEEEDNKELKEENLKNEAQGSKVYY